ncbi:MAG TPA: polyprenyl synthetase family protein [Actinomycetota bacterium]|nr:polyprenyl synthetase family protein [Actinomycetota bacterium]
MSRALSRDLVAPDPALERAVRSRLDEVEDALHRAVRSETRLVAEAGRYLIDAGGKRFRPMLALLSGHFGNPEDPRLITGAVAVELTHLATLYHDDVIDEARFRRGIPSVNARWGNTVAILTGDFLFAKSSEVASELGREVTKLLAVTIGKVAEGQIGEVEVAGRVDIDEATYRHVIGRKTASLIATSCQVGGILSGADPDVQGSLARFGEGLGMAFQLSDDIMDLISDEETLGKEPGVDLKEGVYTLPVILALKSDDGDELRDLLGDEELEGDRFHRALEIVRSERTLDEAREAVADEVRGALAEAARLPDGSPREALEHLARFLATRCGAGV